MVQIEKGKLSIVKKIKNCSFIRRQDSPQVYDINASIYIWKRNYLLKDAKLINDKTHIYIMPEKRSIDIDTLFDFKIVKNIIENSSKFN